MLVTGRGRLGSQASMGQGQTGENMGKRLQHSGRCVTAHVHWEAELQAGGAGVGGVLGEDRAGPGAIGRRVPERPALMLWGGAGVKLQRRLRSLWSHLVKQQPPRLPTNCLGKCSLLAAQKSLGHQHFIQRVPPAGLSLVTGET